MTCRTEATVPVPTEDSTGGPGPVLEGAGALRPTRAGDELT